MTKLSRNEIYDVAAHLSVVVAIIGAVFVSNLEFVKLLIN